ncbi:hypothetical protein SNA_39415 [Streptomyces natalensis ATCC 27448]|uniref:Uncharacterized protein n=1 Tax=Streptomyces natalensis ATCC 27448 TaxID=1240678 RepID=A0A0D7CC78_9ACTN|nr:hypothetical protein SNA_39415 [Streptomyces natalensis ATCC 27448]
MKGGRWSADWWHRRAQLTQPKQASLRHRRQLQRELDALAVDPVFAAEFATQLRRCIVQRCEEALLAAIFDEVVLDLGDRIRSTGMTAASTDSAQESAR